MAGVLASLQKLRSRQASRSSPFGRAASNCRDGREWQAAFDIATYLGRETDNWVAHVLQEVDRLARAYGWREADILAMTATRRRAYLELLAQG